MAANAANPATIAEAGKLDTERRKRDADDLRWILSTAQGRRFLGNLIYDPITMLGGGCGVLHSTFSQSHATMAAQEGARDLAVRILACVEELDFNAAMLIRSERRQEAESAALLTQAATAAAPEQDYPRFEGPVG